MVDINLLPEELRKREEKEKEAAQKRPHVFEVKYTAPEASGRPGGISRGAQDKGKRDALPQPKASPVGRDIMFSRKEERADSPSPVPIPKFQKSGRSEPIRTEEIHVKPNDEKEIALPKRPAPSAPRAAPEREAKKIEKKPKFVPVISAKTEIYQIGQTRAHWNLWQILKSFFSKFFRRKKKVPLPSPAALSEPPKQPLKEEMISGKITVTPRPAPQAIVPPKAIAPDFTPKTVIPQKPAAPVPPQIPVSFPKPSAVPPALTPPTKEIPTPPRRAPEAAPGIKEKKEKREVEKVARTLEINLIPDTVSTQEMASGFGKKLLVLVLSFAGSALVVALVYGGIKLYEQQIGTAIHEIDVTIDEKRKKILEYDKERREVEALQAKMNLLDELLSKHVHWTRVLTALENYTVEDVYFTNFVASRDGGLMLSAIGKDYTSVARQLVTFQEAKDFVLLAETNSASATVETEGEKPKILQTFFTINVRMAPDIFYVNLENEEKL